MKPLFQFLGPFGIGGGVDLVPTSKWSSVGKRGGFKSACAVFLLCAPTAIASPDQDLHNSGRFQQNVRTSSMCLSSKPPTRTTTGQLQLAEPTGTVFKITARGTLTTIYMKRSLRPRHHTFRSAVR
jgi:hypothetical protein